MKNFLFFILLSGLARGQTLHHQMVSTQGLSNYTKKGFYVSQTVGQPIVAKGFKNSALIIQQGFQQSMFSKANQLIVNPKQTIVAKVYPNPFASIINVNFSSEIIGDIECNMIDASGRTVFSTVTRSSQNNIRIEGLEFLPTGGYLLTLKAENLKYTYQLIKN